MTTTCWQKNILLLSAILLLASAMCGHAYADTAGQRQGGITNTGAAGLTGAPSGSTSGGTSSTSDDQGTAPALATTDKYTQSGEAAMAAALVAAGSQYKFVRQPQQ